jgi:type II secretory pathway component PulM
MRARLENMWQSRMPRERQVLAVLLALVLACGYALGVIALERARTQARSVVETLRAQTDRLDQYAQELSRLRAAPQVRPSSGDLRTLVQTQAAAAGLDRSLASLEAIDANQVRAVFEAVPYGAWLAGIATLQAQFVQLSNCRIEALPAPGLVRVTATFVRPTP